MASAFILQGSASLLSLVLGLVLPRWLPESDLSQYLLASTVIQTGALMAMLGTRQTIERSYGVLRAKSHETAGVFLASLAAGRGLATLGGVLVSIGLAVSFRSAGLSDSLIGLIVALVILRSLSEFPFHVLLSCGEKMAGAWPQTVRYAVRVPAVLVGYHVAGLVGVFIGTAAAELGLAWHGWRRAWPELRWTWRGIAPPEIRSEWSFARTVSVYSLLVIGLNQLGPWTAGWLGSNPAELVDFSMAWQLALQFLQLHYIAQQAALPGLTALFMRGAAEEFLIAVDGQLRATWIVSSTLVGCLAATAEPLVAFAFGGARQGLAQPLVIGFAAVSAWAMVSVHSHALFAVGRPKPTVVLHGAMLGLAALLFAGIAPSHGTQVLPSIYLVISVSGWILALGVYCAALKCPLSVATTAKIAASAVVGLMGLTFGRALEPGLALPLFLILHILGIAGTGLLRNRHGTALRKLLFAP